MEKGPAEVAKGVEVAGAELGQEGVAERVRFRGARLREMDAAGIGIDSYLRRGMTQVDKRTVVRRGDDLLSLLA